MQHPVPLLAPERAMAGPEGQELLAVAADVLASGRYILGAQVEAFEQEAARLLRVPFALGVSSGTDALLLALMALGVRPGDQIVCPSYTFFATAGIIERLGARPIFVDCCPACMTLDPKHVERAISPLTRAIVPVHLFGHGANMARINALASEHGVEVIEDAAQAMGTTVQKKHVGTWGTLGCYSFFPSKNLGGFGDGGMVVGHDPKLMAKAASMRVHGSGTPRYLHRHVGGNFRLDALQAALLRQRLPLLPGALARRQSHGQLYHELFMASGQAQVRRCQCAAGGNVAASPTAETCHQAPLALPTFAPGETINQYVITLPNQEKRDRLMQVLQRHHIGHSVYYPLPLHMQTCFAHLGYTPEALPVAKLLSETSLALPVAAELTCEEIRRVAQTVLKGIES